MRILFAICILVVGVVAGCGGGPTAPGDGNTDTARVTPVPTAAPRPAPTPGVPCRPYPKCLG